MVDRRFDSRTAKSKSHYVRKGLVVQAVDQKRLKAQMQTFSQMWLHNINMYRMNLKNPRSLRELYGSWNDEPILVVAAGPSLHKNIREIMKAQAYGFKIVAVDAAFKTLKRNGIKPDITFCMDAQEHVANFFDDCVEEDDNFALCLITDQSVYEKVKHANLWFFGCVNPHNDFWERVIPTNFSPQFACVRSVTVVTGSAVDASMWLGGQPIVTVGNDLCWYDHESIPQAYKDRAPIYRLFTVNAKTLEARSALKYTSFIDSEGNAEVFFTPEGFMKGDNELVRLLTPKDIYTIRGFISAREHFQVWPVLYPDGKLIKDDIRFIDCSGGLMRGWENMALEEAINQYRIKGDTNEKDSIVSCGVSCAVC